MRDCDYYNTKCRLGCTKGSEDTKASNRCGWEIQFEEREQERLA